MHSVIKFSRSALFKALRVQKTRKIEFSPASHFYEREPNMRRYFSIVDQSVLKYLHKSSKEVSLRSQRYRISSINPILGQIWTNSNIGLKM